jgi:hypothetical protein
MGSSQQKENAIRSSLDGAPVKNNSMRSTNPDIPRPALEKHPEPAAKMHHVMIARDWKRVEKNTLQGFVTLETPSGLVLKEVSLHQRESNRWIGLPAKPWTRADGTTGWTPMVEFKDQATRQAFQVLALAAIDIMFAELAGGRDDIRA